MQKKCVFKLMLLVIVVSLIMAAVSIAVLSHTPEANPSSATQSGASQDPYVNCDSKQPIPCCPPGCSPGYPGCPRCIRCEP